MEDSKRPKRVNRTLSSRANVLFLDVAHALPLLASIVVGLCLGIFLKLSIFWTFLWMVPAFLTWLISAGENPGRYRAKFNKVPIWTRARVRHTDPLHKRKVGRIRK